jgi:itaconyl-CoA hydratase/mesaconyl-C4 CoA hydratase
MIRGTHSQPEDLHPMSATDWIGRSETAHDHLSHNLLTRIAATFGEPVPEHGAALPPLWQWCFFQDPLPESALGTDGHPGLRRRAVTAAPAGWRRADPAGEYTAARAWA